MAGMDNGVQWLGMWQPSGQLGEPAGTVMAMAAANSRGQRLANDAGGARRRT